MHPPLPPSSSQPPSSSLQYPQQYLNQNNARNWTTSPNLGPKIKIYPFWLKIGTHGILELFIPTKSRLRFLKFWPQNSFFEKIWAQKFKVICFFLKIGAHSISRMQIPNLDLELWNSKPKTHFWASFGWKSQSCSFFLKIGMHGILTILIPTLVFWIANSKSSFEQI